MNGSPLNEPPSKHERLLQLTHYSARAWERRSVRWGLLLLLLVFLIYFIRHYTAVRIHETPAISVALSPVKYKNVPVYVSALGNVSAVNTVTVRTQVNGLLMTVPFKEGQLVRAGDLLAEIDQRPLLAQLMQYEGQLRRDQALLDNARIDLARYQRLWKQDSVAEQTFATQKTLVQQYEGNVEVDRGLIQSTRLNLIYTRIISPVDGRIGLRLVDPGNYVQTSDTTGIAVITTLNPVTVIFSIPEDSLPKILPKVLAGQKMQVNAYDRSQSRRLAVGTLLAVDSQIDASTGTVKIRAQFENKEDQLFPNQFVNIKLQVDNLFNAITVETAAIQHGSNGDFVYLWNPDATVSAKAVKAGVTSGEDTVIEQGLVVGQQVVVEGADKLTNGSRVKAAEAKKIGRKSIKSQPAI